MSIVIWLILTVPLIPIPEGKGHPSGSSRKEVQPVTQPVQFSHRLHISLGLECAFCHPTAESQEQAGLPSATLCMTCHESINRVTRDLKRLKKLAETGSPIAWEPVYQLPFFVFFGHKDHSEAGIPCSSCHGPVDERDALAPEGDISMAGCVDCHQRQKAPLECHVCHELNQ